MKPGPAKIEDVQKTRSPGNKDELSTFLEMIRYLSPFIPNLSSRCGVLTDLMKEKVPFQWDGTHERCFDEIKNAILRYYDPKEPVRITTDASQQGLGGVHQQPDKQGTYKPVAYASKTLTDTQRNYSNIERELLGICYGVERFRT